MSTDEHGERMARIGFRDGPEGGKMIEVKYIIHNVTPNTPEWLEWRRDHIGASEAPAIITDRNGVPLSPWATPRDVWADKKHPAERSHEKSLGHYLEEAALAWARDQLAERGTVEHGPVVTSVVHPWASASLDGLMRDPQGHPVAVVECKSDQHFTPPDDPTKCWGEEGTADVPHYVYAQCQWQLMVTGLPIAYVPMFSLRDRAFRLYVVPRADEMIKAMLRIVSAWRERYIVGDEEPPIDDNPSKGPHTQYLRARVESEDEPAIEQATEESAEWISEYLEASETEKAAKNRKSVLRDRLMDVHAAATKIEAPGMVATIIRGKRGVSLRARKIKGKE